MRSQRTNVPALLRVGDKSCRRRLEGLYLNRMATVGGLIAGNPAREKSAKLTCIEITTAAGFEALRGEWNQLADQLVPRSP